MRRILQNESANAGAQSGHVYRMRRRDDHHAGISEGLVATESDGRFLHISDQCLALVHRAIRQLRPRRLPKDGARAPKPKPCGEPAVKPMQKRCRAIRFKWLPPEKLRKGDIILVETGDIIPSDGEVVEGIASVDESAVTGESAPVIRESGGDKSSVTGGTKVLSDWLKIKVMANPGETFLDKMIALVEGAKRQKTPNEIALTILLIGLTIVFLMAVATLEPFAIYSGAPIPVIMLIALLVCLIPTTIGGLLSSIGIAGMDRLLKRNVLAMSGRAVEAAGDVNVLLLDKTGTITLGNRMATDFVPAPQVDRMRLADAAQLSSLADEDSGRAQHRGPGQKGI